MSTSTLIETPAAQDERATLLVGFELGKSSWLIDLYAPERGKTVSRHKIDGGDLGKVVELIAAMRGRLEKLGKPVRVVSIYEAGYDGLWLHRALRAAGVDNRVIDAASVPVDRRARRVKTERLDLEQLLRMLLALERGETRACRVVRVPSPAEEDAKRQHRERQVLVAERTGHGNRITVLLMTLGISDVSPRRRDFVAHLQTLRTGDGEPLPPHGGGDQSRRGAPSCPSLPPSLMRPRPTSSPGVLELERALTGDAPPLLDLDAADHRR